MKFKAVAVLVLVLGTGACFAQSSVPSDASINELLEVMHARAAVDAAAAQIDGLMKNSMQQALAGRAPTAEQQQIMDEIRDRVAKLYADQLGWDKMQPMYLRIYKASFTQDEVDGMVGFYKSTAGQAVVKKLPLVMQNTLSEMQKMLPQILQQAQVAAQEAQRKLQAGAAPDGTAGVK
jgi:hypothetical protein